MTSLVNLQKKMLQEAKITEERNSNGENDPEHLSEEERVDIRKPETMIVSHLFMKPWTQIIILSFKKFLVKPWNYLVHSTFLSKFTWSLTKAVWLLTLCRGCEKVSNDGHSQYTALCVAVIGNILSTSPQSIKGLLIKDSKLN